MSKISDFNRPFKALFPAKEVFLVYPNRYLKKNGVACEIPYWVD